MDTLSTIVESSLAQPVPLEVHKMAEHIRLQCRNVQAIFAYGSTLRGVPTHETLIDFYVIVSTHEDYAHGLVSRVFAKIAPPNVYYTEIEMNGCVLRSKYAVIPMGVLWHRVRSSEHNPYFWVRFCQPMALVHVASDTARQQACYIVSDAIRTAYGFASGLAQADDPLKKWSALFSETYRTELRPESAQRSVSIVESQRDYFLALFGHLDNIEPLHANWTWERLRGKGITLLRLAKAAGTFSGGVEYIAWKIERHSGFKVELSPWQKNHPVMAGLLLLPQLLRKGILR